MAKRIAKEEKEVMKLDAHLKILNSQHHKIEISSTEELVQARSELEEAKNRFVQSTIIQDQEFRKGILECEKFNDCQDWMVKVQRIIWPTNSEELTIGRPLGPDWPEGFHIEKKHLSQREQLLLRQLLPSGIITIVESAMALEIDKIDDVLSVLEHFRWMSWCNIALNVLRAPMSTIVLRRLLDAGGPLKFNDDKIMKFFSQTNGKAR